MQARRYLMALVLTCLLLGGTTLAVNALVDPLWYRGAQTGVARTFAYNDRYAKVNLFLADPGRYDCVIFGSSKTMLLDATKLGRGTCFNFAFPTGDIAEYLDYLRFLKHRGMDLRTIIVGVDSYVFTDRVLPNQAPDFVRRLDAPPPMLGAYISPDLLGFSVRRLLGLGAPSMLYYDRDFCVRLVEGMRYEPDRLLTVRTDDKWLPLGPFSPRRSALFAELRRIWPGVRLIGHVPPVSAFYVAHKRLVGTLPQYLVAIHATARHFDEFYDFALPGPVTGNPANTVDGEHFVQAVNDRVARVLSTGRPDAGFGLPLHGLDLEALIRRYRQDTGRFIAAENIRMVHVPIRPVRSAGYAS